MKRIAQRVGKGHTAQVDGTPLKGEGAITRFVVGAGGVQTILEATPVLRGSV